MSDEAISILVVDDDATFRSRLAKALEARGYAVRAAATGEEALELSRIESPERAVVDLRMPSMSGLEVVRGLKALDATTNIVVLTGYGSIATALEAVRFGATHYLTKPANVDAILAAFARAAPSPGAEPIPSVVTEHDVPSLARLEWEHINRVLTDCDGNISQAAKRLSLHRRTLQRKLAKYPVPR